MAKSCVTATVTGSSAWEAMKLGVPGIVFGKTWYSACSGCLAVMENGDLGDGLSALLDMSSEDVISGTRVALQFALDNGLPGFNYLTAATSLTQEDMNGLGEDFASRIRKLVR